MGWYFRRWWMMGRLWVAFGLLGGLACWAAGCDAVPVDPPATVESCDEVTPLFAAEPVLADADHGCYGWLDVTHGRVARSSRASAVVWTRRTAFGTAVLASAMHVLGGGWFGPTGEDVPAMLQDPASGMGVARITLIAEKGVVPDERVSPMFDLYNPALAAEIHNSGLTDILPRDDLVLSVLDDQKLNTTPLLEVPEGLHDAGPAVYDPAGLTTTAPTYAEPVAGELVLMLGYPTGSPYEGTLTAAVGRVLTDAEAEAVIAELAQVGDVEGDIPYAAAVEFLVDGRASGGMSGGGVFDGDGRLLGVLVRASDEREGEQVVRVVRMSYIAGELEAGYAAASAELQAQVAQYIEPFE